jgi:hypothetical protein
MLSFGYNSLAQGSRLANPENHAETTARFFISLVVHTAPDTLFWSSRLDRYPLACPRYAKRAS